ncbi:peptidase [Amycolatopsis sp. MtRt-6]|uniref:peptidase n=1 Tax=Amycolatopsis sp. MtRt-6 TaxID=2792782 RepID=UPI001A8F1E60|nr:peptidase [Amycolatopsis sp. MtRt-6]
MKLRQIVLTVLCVSVTALFAPAASATSGTTGRAEAAAGWLARQLVDGNHFEVEFDGQKFPDAGLTIDGIFAFAAAKVADTAGGNAIAWLARPDVLSGYAGDGTAESYAGATAKASLAAQVRGLDPAAFGGVDLLARLRALLTPSGRFSDHSAFGDFSNSFSQALAIITLARTPGGAPAAAVDFEAGTQCPDGSFPPSFDAGPCVGDTDATAVVIQAMLAAGRPAVAQRALTWLVGKQQANGGLSTAHGDPGSAPNANTTGVAGQAFRAGGRIHAAQKAKAFVVSLQVGCEGAPADRGAIAFDASGVNPNNVVRATAQGVLGLGAPSLAKLTAAGSKPSAPELVCP